MAETITVDALRARLDAGEKLTVVDVRETEDFEEWRIPGAVHVNAYDALAAGKSGVLDDADLPRDQPIVAVCYAGVTSRVAARSLRERGLDAYSLAGGMNAWSLAWNLAEVPLPGSKARVLQIRRTGKGCLSYMIGSDGEALVLDPSAEVSVYRELARANGWRITHVVDTHVHADHLSRARTLATEVVAKHHAPRTTRNAFAYEPVDDGTRIPVGHVELVALRTPGHTPESTCYHLDGRVLFTGDTLFLDAVGRPDLEADREQARQRSVALHGSLARLLRLAPDTLVLPCHTSEPTPFDKRPIVAALHEVRERTPMTDLPLDQFVARLTERLPAPPPNHHQIVLANEAGELLLRDTTGLEAGANRCAAR